jgi:hypothetical protein
LIDLLGGIGMRNAAEGSRDILECFYEYCLGVFTGATGRQEGKTL